MGTASVPFDIAPYLRYTFVKITYWIGVFTLSEDTAQAKRFNIEAVPVLNLFVATDKQFRLRLSADIIEYFALEQGGRVALGYDRTAQAIAIKRAASADDPTAATIDKRGYVSARPFYHRTRLEAEGRRYIYAATQEDWLVFIAGELRS